MNIYQQIVLLNRLKFGWLVSQAIIVGGTKVIFVKDSIYNSNFIFSKKVKSSMGLIINQNFFSWRAEMISKMCLIKILYPINIKILIVERVSVS